LWFTSIDDANEFENNKEEVKNGTNNINEIQKDDSDHNSSGEESYNNDGLSSIYSLVDEPQVEENKAYYHTMRTDPIANFENAGDSGATQYPKKKMSCTNLPHRKVDFSNSYDLNNFI